jgi:hypothetical protein
MMAVLSVITLDVIILIVVAPTEFFVSFFVMAVPNVIVSSVIILIVMEPTAFFVLFYDGSA